MNKRGSVPILLAAAIPPIFVMGVFAIDAARIWLDQARLQAAIDAASLMAARDAAPKTDAERNTRNARVTALVRSYFPSASNITVTDPTTGSVKVQGSISTTPLLSGLTGLNVPAALRDSPALTKSAVATRTNTGIELALVIDTTLSMALWDSAGGTDADGKKPARIELARRAARDLTGILYGAQQVSQPNLYISVVPFNVAVNIGAANTALLRTDSVTYSNGHTWSGCVEARLGGNDLTEAKPDSQGTKFPRYFWPNTYNTADTSAGSSSKCTIYQDYNTSSASNSSGACTGDNDWTAPQSTQLNNPLLQAARAFSSYDGDYVVGTGNYYFSPNFMCPSVPILPLTMHRGKVEATIDALVGTPNSYSNTVPNSSANTYYPNTPYPYGYGTVIASGLQGAWYTLSQEWRGYWPNPNPVVNGQQLTPPSPLPLDYGTDKMVKVVLLLSDGDNNWFNARSPQNKEDTYGTGSGNTLVRPASRRTEMFYNAYGRLSVDSNRLGITVPNSTASSYPNSSTLAADYDTIRDRADAKLDAITLDLCTKMKAKGIVIYAVGLGVAETAHHNLLQACVTPMATSTERNKYIRTNNAGELRAAFTQVANELANLRLSE